MSATPATQRSDANAASVIAEAAAVYGRHAATVVSASVLIQTVSVFATFVAMNKGGIILGSFWVLLIAVTTTLLTTGIYTVLLLTIRTKGIVLSITELIGATLPHLPRLLAIAVITSILTGLASIFFLLPGLYLTIRWAVSAPSLIAGSMTSRDAMRTSWHLTEGHMMSTFVVILFQFACTLGVAYIARRATGGAFGNEEDVLLVQAAISALLLPLPTLATAELFLRLARVPTLAPGQVRPVDAEPTIQPYGAPSAWQPQAGAQPVPAGPYVPKYVPQQPAPAAHQPPPGLAPPAYGAPAAAQGHPHFTDAPHGQQPYAPPAPQPAPGLAPQQPQPYAMPPQPHVPRPAQPQPYAQQPTQPQPYATQQPYAQQPQPQAHTQQPAPAQPYVPPAQPYAPPQPGAHPGQPAPPARPSRSESVGPPGMG